MDQTGISEDVVNGLDQIFPSDYLLDSQILNLIPQAVYVCDMSGVIRKYNEQAVQLWGRRPVLGDEKERFNGAWKLYNSDETLLPHDQAQTANCIKDGLSRKNEEIIIERPDLFRIHVLVNVMPIIDDKGKQIGVINSFTDISDQKRLMYALKKGEQALSESEMKYRELAAVLEKEVEDKVRDLKRKTEELKNSEERYHKMVEEVEDYAILLLNKEGIIQNWNKGAEKIKGYKEEEIVGKSFQEFYLPEDRQKGLPLRLLELARTTGKAIHEGWRKRKDGSAFWGSIVLTALHDDEKNVIGFSKVTRDLTERKLAEDKLQEYLAQLEFQNKELEQFVYAASHDMKEPLRKIHFYNDFISGDNSNQLSSKSRDYLNRSINAASRMKQLIEDLLIYSRSTSNIDSYKTVDLNEVINEVLYMHREELDRIQGTITIAELPVIQAVPFQIKQLLFNLVNNAVKYKHPERKLHIDVTYELVNSSEIEDYIPTTDTHYHKICIIDNGTGFDDQYSRKIFEIFQRLNNVSETRGTGIGLAICKKIAQNHRGFIGASGKLNEGATFSIYLPQA